MDKIEISSGNLAINQDLTDRRVTKVSGVNDSIPIGEYLGWVSVNRKSTPENTSFKNEKCLKLHQMLKNRFENESLTSTRWTRLFISHISHNLFVRTVQANRKMILTDGESDPDPADENRIS
jgi:hypothetical protein